MSDEKHEPRVESVRLYKFDASKLPDGAPPDPNTTDALNHPACLECIEVGPGGQVRTIIRRT